MSNMCSCCKSLAHWKKTGSESPLCGPASMAKLVLALPGLCPSPGTSKHASCLAPIAHPHQLN
eukprot:12412721-Prorocentrum_lima.AAC.1